MMHSSSSLLLPLLVIACSASEEPDSPVAPLTPMSGGSGGVSAAAGGSSGGLVDPNVAGSGGALASTGGAAGASAVGGSGGDGAAQGGAGAGGQGQGGGPGETNGDTPPWRELAVTAPPNQYIHGFTPSDANPAATGIQNDNQVAVLDTTVPLRGKLVVFIGSSGGGRWDYPASRGFHTLGLDFLGVNEYPNGSIVRGDAEFYGAARLESLTGVDLTDEFDIDLAHSFLGHLTDGLAFLHATYPAEDWGYYLNEDGSVRFSDVYLSGSSHGASSSALFATQYRLGRVITIGGPRDNSCGDDPMCMPETCPGPPCGVVATWLAGPSETPADRFFGITGTLDAQHGEILYAMEELAYPGDPIDVTTAAPPYNDSHRLTVGGQGHERFCIANDELHDSACDYLFGVE